MHRMERMESSGVKLHIQDEGRGTVGRGAVSTQVTSAHTGLKQEQWAFRMEDIRVSVRR